MAGRAEPGSMAPQAPRPAVDSSQESYDLDDLYQGYFDEVPKKPRPTGIFGANAELGQMLGLDNAWVVNLIRALGNYGEIFERNLAPIGLQRGPNALWTTPVGQQYAPPFR